MTFHLMNDLQEKLDVLNKLESEDDWEKIAELCRQLAFSHQIDQGTSKAAVLYMSLNGKTDYVRIYVDAVLSLQSHDHAYIDDLMDVLAKENLEANAYLYLLDALKRHPVNAHLIKKAADISLYLGYLDEAYHWTASLSFSKPAASDTPRRNRLELFLGKRAQSYPFQILAGFVYSRSSGSTFKPEDPPGESELFSQNPDRTKFLKNISGWENVYAGSLNLYTHAPPRDVNRHIVPIAYEAGVNVTYPDPHATVPKERFGYWYYTGFVFFSGKAVPVLFRYPDFRQDARVLEVFSSERLRATLELSDNDQVLCYFCSEQENMCEWLQCKLDIYAIFARNQQAFGRRGELYQAHESWKLPGQRPTLSRIASYNLRKWISSEDHILDIGCNIGCFGIETSMLAASYTGFDNNPDLIAIATRLAKHKHADNCTFTTCSFDQFRAGNNKKFDLIFSFAVHVWIGIPMQAYIEQLKNMLASGGTVIIESNNLDTNDSDFMKNMELFLKAGFMLLYQGELKDDGVIRRAFCVFKALQ